MKKRIQALVMSLILIITMSVGSVVFAADNITVKLNGQTLSFDVPPQLINGRTMVPMRAIFENLGATVNWEQSTQTVTSVKGTTTISLTIGVPSIIINGSAKALDTAPCVIDGRTLVPVRAVSEAFNLNVDWDGATNTVIINSYSNNVSTYAPEYITDFSVEYEDESDMFRVFFGFKDANYQYVKYNGVAKINFENENGENVYSKEHNVDESMFGSYTRMITGNTQYILCEIDIPVSQIKKGKVERGTVTLDFSNNGITYGQLKDSCFDLPILSGSELANISYDKSFTLTEYYSSGRLWRKMKISSFEITNVELAYSGKLKVSYRVTGTVDGDNYCSFDAKCYDEDGFVIGTGMIHEQVSEGETFRFADDMYIPDGTVRIEFVVD